jgi:hypothetical protein
LFLVSWLYLLDTMPSFPAKKECAKSRDGSVQVFAAMLRHLLLALANCRAGRGTPGPLQAGPR